MKHYLFLLSLLGFCTAVFSKDPIDYKLKDKDGLEKAIYSALKPEAVIAGGYDEFDFSSNQGSLFNKYSGHTNSVAAGVDYLNFHNIYWGFNFHNITTNTNTNTLLSIDPMHGHLSIKDNGVYLHAMKAIAGLLLVDVFANYGRDKFNLTSTANSIADPFTGYATYHGDTTMAGIRTFFGKNYGAFSLQGQLSYFFTNFYQSNYTVGYPAGISVPVPSLTTKIGTTVEQAQLYYQVNDYFSPFITGGLVQLVSRDYSRPVISPGFTAIATLPQILIGRYGYNVGAGINYHYKNIRIVPMYIHSARGSTYSDDFVGVTLGYSGFN